jgi:hypothetical protein
MVQFLVEHGACIYATTIRDNETAAEKCEEEEENYAICSQYLLCKLLDLQFYSIYKTSGQLKMRYLNRR